MAIPPKDHNCYCSIVGFTFAMKRRFARIALHTHCRSNYYQCCFHIKKNRYIINALKRQGKRRLNKIKYTWGKQEEITKYELQVKKKCMARLTDPDQVKSIFSLNINFDHSFVFQKLIFPQYILFHYTCSFKKLFRILIH